MTGRTIVVRGLGDHKLSDELRQLLDKATAQAEWERLNPPQTLKEKSDRLLRNAEQSLSFIRSNLKDGEELSPQLEQVWLRDVLVDYQRLASLEAAEIPKRGG